MEESTPSPTIVVDEEKAPTPTYRGAGIVSDPFVVEFSPGDSTNPKNFSSFRKWLYVAISTFSVLAMTMTSAAYTGSAIEIRAEFNIDSETYAAGVALYVLGFAIGPCLWAPLSELYGRRIWFITTHAGAVAFVGGTAGAPNVTALLIFRFITGVFAASPLTNSGGIIADLFVPAQSGTPLALFSAAPFLGPVIGPLVGGFISESIGWRWVQGVMAIFIGVVWLVGWAILPETYGPVILSRKAAELSKKSGKLHKSVVDVDRGDRSAGEVFGTALKRPWVLLFFEPIVLISSAYLSVLYGTIYMFLGAFPIVYQELRGWSEGIGGLAFLGLTVGMIFGVSAMIIYDKVWYPAEREKRGPEARLPLGCVGAIFVPLGMFSFAWTTYPSIHWSAGIILSSLFGFGTVLLFVTILNYIIDAYLIYAASALAATAMMRSFFGTAFPLFTSKMYGGIGIHWASSIPAFLTLICMPFPFLMLRYGPSIRLKCRYAKEAAMVAAKLQKKE